MAIFLGVSAAPERILLSEIRYAPVQHSSPNQIVLLWGVMPFQHSVLIVKALLLGANSREDPSGPNSRGLFRDCQIFANLRFPQWVWVRLGYAPCPDDNQWSRQTSWHVASVGRCSDPATGHVTNVTPPPEAQVHS